MIVALDGPAAAGKGTIARAVALKYGFAYLDTGSLYRAVGRDALVAQVSLDDEAAVAKLAAQIDPERLSDPALRTPNVSQAASRVAAYPSVRAALLEFQREFARQPRGAVLDGRDIGTVVCPDADVKIFVTADLETRARRRAQELDASGHATTLQDVTAAMAERDARDAERDAAPMAPAPDARLLDTSDLSIDAAFEAACRFVDAARAAF